MDNITGQMRGLTINRDRAEDRTSQVNSSLAEAINNIYKAGTSISQPWQEIDVSATSLDTGDATNLLLLHRGAQVLAKSANNLVNAAKRAILERVIARGLQGDHTSALLKHFDDEIMAIARRVFESAGSDTTCLMWKIAEECYNEATKSSGKLHTDHYFVPIEETYLGTPYNQDFESEAYYEHEDRLDLDEGYAAMSAWNEELRYEAMR